MLPFSLMCCTFVIKPVELVFYRECIENLFIIIICIILLQESSGGRRHGRCRGDGFGVQISGSGHQHY